MRKSDEIVKAAKGNEGALTAWLESKSEDEIREAIMGLATTASTKREHFASLAMQSIVGSKHFEIQWWAQDIKQQTFAQAACGYADALMAELEKTTEQE